MPIVSQDGNEVIESSGDVIFRLREGKTVRGLPEVHSEISYGSMYADDITRTVSVAAAHTHYPIAGSLTGGLCSSAFTFQNSKELKCNTAGKYLVTWSMSLSNSASDQTIEGLVIVNSAGQDNTVNATRAKESGVVYSVAGTGIISLAVNDLVRLGVEKENGTASTITVNHVNLTLTRVE